MPRGNRMGPWNMGPMTGRGLGPCGGGRGYGYGYGYGYGGGFGPALGWRGHFDAPGYPYAQGQNRKEFLLEQKELLKEELSWINEELDREKTKD